MKRRVFLDIGGHFGETLAEVVKPRWAFDRIWVFEPATACRAALDAFADERTHIVNAGWWSSDTEMELHDPGSIGASVIAGKALTETVERCHFVDAARWMAENVMESDVVWMKLNCEAAEVDVLDRLLTSGEIRKVHHLMVHFDVEKVPGMEHRAADMRSRLGAAGVAFVESREIGFGRPNTAKNGTANWLSWTEASYLGRLRYSVLNRIIFRARQRLYPLKKARARTRSSVSRPDRS
jgi:FkbM family methyltransferase